MKSIHKISTATKQDIPFILNFIKELSVQNHNSEFLKVNESLLEEALFGKNSFVECLVANKENLPIGYVLFTKTFSTLLGKPGLHLIDIFVMKEHRRNGVAYSFIKYLANLSKQRGYIRIDWSVLKNNKNAICFYKKIGSKALNEWKNYRLEGDALNNLASLEQNKG